MNAAEELPDFTKVVELAAEKLAQRLDPDRLIGKEEAAMLFGCSPRTFAEKLAVKPEFPKQRRCGRWNNRELRQHLNRQRLT